MLDYACSFCEVTVGDGLKMQMLSGYLAKRCRLNQLYSRQGTAALLLQLLEEEHGKATRTQKSQQKENDSYHVLSYGGCRHPLPATAVILTTLVENRAGNSPLIFHSKLHTNR